MNLPVILSPAADREFDESTAWYERQGRLGERFLEHVQKALDRIGQVPELPAEVHRGIRRVRVRQFPHGQFYRILDDRIEVIAIFHNKRDSKVWQSRACARIWGLPSF